MHKASDQNKRFVIQFKCQSIQSDAPCQDNYFRYRAVYFKKTFLHFTLYVTYDELIYHIDPIRVAVGFTLLLP